MSAVRTFNSCDPDPQYENPDRCKNRHRAFINIIIFVIVASLWVVLDKLSKSIVDAYSVGDKIAGPFFGLFEFVLVHNSGAAWGMFGDMTYVLAIISVVICVLILVYLFVMSSQMSHLSAFSLALVFAGGIGNAIDRFANLYVIDFISTTFIDFPVFNIADIGVTCGVVLFIVSLIMQGIKDRRSASENADVDMQVDDDTSDLSGIERRC